MAIKIPTSSIAKPSKLFPDWDFWFEYMMFDFKVEFLTQFMFRIQDI
jgi:hypothetical protein